MLERERKQTIFRLLDLHTFASIHDVVEATGASEATVRRDFIELEREKRLRRVRGGVELTQVFFCPNHECRRHHSFTGC